MGTGKATSILELVNLSSEFLKVKPRLTYKSAGSDEISNFITDTTKLEKIFKRKLGVPLKEGLRHTFSWLKEFSSD